MKIEGLKFNESGLIPAVIQDHITNEVLMVAWMNEESLKLTLEEKRVCFWSRSRKELWRKGATSGNVQQLVSVFKDCDADTLLIKVIQTGFACHKGEKSCFTRAVYEEESSYQFSLAELYSLIKNRQLEKKEGSYTTYLFEKGADKILKKVGEESAEVIIAAKNGDKDEVICEISDLIYHVLVLMVQKEISLADIKGELEKRHVIDKKIKQETLNGEHK